MKGAREQEPAVVSLTIPCRAEYVSVARLAIMGVASRLDFAYDGVEDLRLAVSEVCTTAINRAGARAQDDATITINCRIQPEALTVEVNYNLDTAENQVNLPTDAGDLQEASMDPRIMGALLVELLVDSVEMENDPVRGTTVRLLKRVQPS